MSKRGRPRIREKAVEDYFNARAKANNFMVVKVRWIARKYAPDRYLTGISKHPGARVDYNSAWVELKAPGLIPTPGQKREHNRLREMGDMVFVLDTFAAVNLFFARITAFQIDEPTKGI
jgi:hypothetical protein